MNNKYITIDISDPRTENIADVISNKTSKKILSFLAEKEMSQTDLAKALNSPINTIDYNIKKLVDSGLIEKVKRFFWSSKGKKINIYKISNKKIIISPKTITKGILPTIIIALILAVGMKLITQMQNSQIESQLDQMAAVSQEAGKVAVMPYSQPPQQVQQDPQYWLWFLLGSLTSILIYLLITWRKNE